jgi:uncharacterized protein (TIGR03032 family)
VTREYEHLVMGLGTRDGRPQVTYMRMPHPSGIAVDRDRGGRVMIAGTRNPNQVVTLAPATAPALAQGDRPLLPVAATYYPGSLRLHDLALVGGRLHGAAAGRDAVVRLDRDGAYAPAWWPASAAADGPPDHGNHLQLNSIAAGKNLAASFFTASASKPGRLRPGDVRYPVDGRGVVFSGRTREVVAGGLTRPHSARLHDGVVWVDNSGYAQVGVVAGDRFEPVAALPGWTRGLCFVDDVAFVATSRVIPRFRAYAPGVDTESCGVHAVDAASGRVLASLTWPEGSQVFAVDWLPAGATSGLPFTAGRGASADVAARLFYDYDLMQEEAR